MIGIVRPLLRRYGARQREISRETLAFALLLLFLSAWTTERIGIHALFGAFVAGAILPRTETLARILTGHLETIASVLFLPLFFAYTGLRTSIHLLSGGTLWFYCALIVMVAVLGKLFGCAAAGRVSGMSWRDALTRRWLDC